MDNFFSEDDNQPKPLPNVRQNLLAAKSYNPDQVARAVETRDMDAISLPMAVRNLDRLETKKSDLEWAKQFDEVEKRPDSLGTFLANEDNAMLAHDDIPYLSGIADVAAAPFRGINVGMRSLPDTMAATYEAMSYAAGGDKADAPVTFEEKMPVDGAPALTFQGFGDAVTSADGVLETAKNVAIFGGETAGQALASSAPSLVLSSAGAAAGTAIGTAVGAPAAGVGAAPGAAAGAIIGAGAGAFLGSSSQTVGEFYLELKQAAAEYNKDPANAGNPITLQDIGRKSLVWGAALAIPDSIVPGKAGREIASAVGGDLIKTTLKSQAKTALGDIISRKALKAGAKDVVQDAGIEMGTEAVQEAGKIYGVNDAVGKDPFTQEALTQVVEAGIGGFFGGVGISGASKGISNTINLGKQLQQAKQNKAWLEGMKKAINNPDGKLNKRSPQALNDFLQAATGDAKIHVDGEAVQEFYQKLSDEDRAAMAVQFPDFERELAEAVGAKGDMMFSQADYLTYMQPKDTQEWLDKNSRMLPEHFSIADVEEHDAMLSEIFNVASLMDNEDDAAKAAAIFREALQQPFGQRIAPSGTVDVSNLYAERFGAFYKNMQKFTDNNPRLKAALDALVLDFKVQRALPDNVKRLAMLDEFDLTIDKVRNRVVARKDRLAKRAELAMADTGDLLGQKKAAKATGTATPKNVINALGDIGRVKTGSDAANKLREIGITSKNYPKLFNKDGLIDDLSAVPQSELMGKVGSFMSVPSEDGQYVARDWLLETMRDEDFGLGAMDDAQRLTAEQEAEYADIEDAVARVGLDLADATNEEVKAAIKAAAAEERGQYEQEALNDAFGEALGQYAAEDIIYDDQPQAEDYLSPEQEAVLADMVKEAENPTPFEPAKEPDTRPLEEQAKAIEAEAQADGQPSQTITDFGEKIGGARKDIWGASIEKLREALPEDTDLSLTKHFPNKSIDELVAAGLPFDNAILYVAARRAIPTKPKMPGRVRRWAADFKYLREIAAKALEQGLSPSEVLEDAKGNIADNMSRELFASQFTLMYAMGHPLATKMSGKEMLIKRFGRLSTESNSTASKDIYYVTKIGRPKDQTAFSNNIKDAIAEFEAILKAKEVEDKPMPKKRSAAFDVYKYTRGDRKGEVVIGKRFSSSRHLDIKGGFASYSDAFDFLEANEPAIIAMFDKMKALPKERLAENASRIGPDYREDIDVTPEKFMATFGFRGVEFGNYVEQARRTKDLNKSYDALLDMASIINVPTQALSLGGKLGLAFGARGTGGVDAASATFERVKNVINLTKNNGPGSLAHEWWHGFDRYLYSLSKGGDTIGMYAEGMNYRRDDLNRLEVKEAFNGVLQAINQKTKIGKRSEVADRARSKPYYSTDVELGARAFEAYLIYKAKQQGYKNNYLANITPPEVWKAEQELSGADSAAPDNYVYALEDEMVNFIAPAFDKLFETLNVRENNGVMELYQNGQKGAPQGKLNTFRGTDGRLRAVMTLFKDEDLSTVLHELGHFFFNTMSELATIEGAPQELFDEINVLRKWAGAEAIEPGKASTDITVAQHELIADAFLSYLKTGKAPSPDLAPAFGRYKVFLTWLYDRAKRILPKITPEVAAVFDRMMATQEQVEAMSKEPIFTLSDDLLKLLPKAQADKMVKRMERALELADEKTLSKAITQDSRKLKATYIKAKAELEDTLRPVIAADRVYTAIAEALRQGGLSKQSVIAAFGREVLPYLKKHKIVASTGGIDVRAVRMMAGYLSDDAMRNDLMNSPALEDAVAKRVDEEMLARYGDMLRDGTLAQEVMVNLHNKRRETVLKMEMRLAAKLAKVPAPSAIAIKSKAQQMVYDMPVYKLVPDRFLRAEKKAQFEYGAAMARGDLGRAVVAKGQQLLNHHLYRESTKAKNSVEKSLKGWRSMLGKSDKQLAERMVLRQKKVTKIVDGVEVTELQPTSAPDISYVYAARAVLSKYGIGNFNSRFDVTGFFAKLKAEDPDANEQLAEAAMMLMSNAPPYMPKSPNAKGVIKFIEPYKHMVFADFVALSDNVANLLGQGVEKSVLKLNGKRIAKEQAVNELIESIGKYDAKVGTLPLAQHMTFKRKGALYIGSASLWARRMDAFTTDIDGGYNGAWNKYVLKPMKESIGRYRDEKRDVEKEFLDLIKPLKDKYFGDPIAAPELLTGKERIPFVFENKAELIGALVHIGNGYAPGSNGYKLLRGYQWGDLIDGELDTSAWQAFLNRMYAEGMIVKEDIDFVQTMWNKFEALKPRIWAAHKDMYHFYPKEVTQVPFTTPWGEYQGGYWPAIVDRDKSPDANDRQIKRMYEDESNFTAFPTTGRGAAQTRSEAYAGPLQLSVKHFRSHADWALRFIHLEPQAKAIGKIMIDSRFKEAAAEIHPDFIKDFVMPWLQRSVRQATARPSISRLARGADAMASYLRRNSALYIMAGNLVNTGQQLLGFAPLITKVPLRYLLRAAKSFSKAPIETAQTIADASYVMRHQSNALIDSDVSSELERYLRDKSIGSKAKTVQEVSEKYGYVLQRYTQNFVNYIGWSAAYDQAMAGKAKGVAATHEAAVDYADRVVTETQGFNAAENISNIEYQTQWAKLFLMFFGWFNNYGNFILTEKRALGRELAAQGAGVGTKALKYFYLYVTIYAIPSLLSDLLAAAWRGNLPEDDDDDGMLDEWAQFVIISQLRFGSAMVPLLNNILNVAIGQFTNEPFDDTLTAGPGLSMLEKVVKLPTKLGRIAEGEGDLSDSVDSVLAMLALAPGGGAMVGPVRRPIKYVADVVEGDSSAETPANVAQGLTTGRSAPN